MRSFVFLLEELHGKIYAPLPAEPRVLFSRVCWTYWLLALAYLPEKIWQWYQSIRLTFGKSLSNKWNYSVKQMHLTDTKRLQMLWISSRISRDERISLTHLAHLQNMEAAWMDAGLRNEDVAYQSCKFISYKWTKRKPCVWERRDHEVML